MKLISRDFVSLALMAMLGYLALYVYGLVMSVFSPTEMLGFTALALAFAAVLGVHAVRVNHALHVAEDPAHRELERSLMKRREQRGF